MSPLLPRTMSTSNMRYIHWILYVIGKLSKKYAIAIYGELVEEYLEVSRVSGRVLILSGFSNILVCGFPKKNPKFFHCSRTGYTYVYIQVIKRKHRFSMFLGLSVRVCDNFPSDA